MNLRFLMTKLKQIKFNITERSIELKYERSIPKKNTQSLIKTAKIKTQRQEIFVEQKSVLRNALKLYYKRNDLLMHL